MKEDFEKLTRIFENCVKENFDFLLRKYNAQVRQVDASTFEFVINSVLIKVLLTKGHNYDINVILKPTKKTKSYGISVVCKALGIDGIFENGFETPNQLVKLVGIYANTLENKLMNLIINNQINWNDVDRYISKILVEREQEASNRIKENVKEKIKNDAEGAFRNKDYRRVIRLLNGLRGVLTSTEKWKLDYALKQVSTRKK